LDLFCLLTKCKAVYFKLHILCSLGMPIWAENCKSSLKVSCNMKLFAFLKKWQSSLLWLIYWRTDSSLGQELPSFHLSRCLSSVQCIPCVARTTWCRAARHHFRIGDLNKIGIQLISRSFETCTSIGSVQRWCRFGVPAMQYSKPEGGRLVSWWWKVDCYQLNSGFWCMPRDVIWTVTFARFRRNQKCNFRILNVVVHWRWSLYIAVHYFHIKDDGDVAQLGLKLTVCVHVIRLQILHWWLTNWIKHSLLSHFFSFFVWSILV